MVNYCCVPGCGSSYGRGHVRLHKFPKEKNLKLLWSLNVKRENPADSTVVCSRHFKEDDYEYHIKRISDETILNSNTNSQFLRKRTLKKGVIPTQQLPKRICRSSNRKKELDDQCLKGQVKRKKNSLLSPGAKVQRKKVKKGATPIGSLLKPSILKEIERKKSANTNKEIVTFDKHEAFKLVTPKFEIEETRNADEVCESQNDESSMTDEERGSEDTLSCSENESALHKTLDKEITNEQGSSIPRWYSLDTTSKSPNSSETAVPVTLDKHEVFKLVTPKFEMIEIEETTNADEVSENHTSSPYTEPKLENCDILEYDELSNFGQHIIDKLRKYGPKTQAYLKSAFNNLLCEADLGKFEKKVTEIPDLNLKPKVKTVSVQTISQCPPKSKVVVHVSGTSACDFILPHD